MKIEFNQTTVTIIACGVMAVFMFGKDIVGGEKKAPTQRRIVTAQVSKNASSEARFKRENRNIELPDGSALEKSYVENNMMEFSEIPFGDEELEYSVELPKNWTRSNFASFGLPGEEKYLILTNIARYFGEATGGARPYLWVETLKLKREITARDYMHAYFAQRGISPETDKILSEKAAESLFVEVDSQTSYAVHGKFIIHGDRLVLVKLGVPIEKHNDLKNLMGYSLKTFKLKRQIDRVVEKQETFKLLNILSYNYLKSWQTAQIEANSTLEASMELHNPHVDGGLNGVIYIQSYRKTPSLKEGILWNDKIIPTLEGRGFSLLNKEEGDIFGLKNLADDNDELVVQEKYNITFKSLLKKEDFDLDRRDENIIRQKMYVTRIDNGNYITYLLLVTPDRDKYYMTWAQNIYAYNLLLDTIDIRKKIDLE